MCSRSPWPCKRLPGSYPRGISTDEARTAACPLSSQPLPANWEGFFFFFAPLLERKKRKTKRKKNLRDPAKRRQGVKLFVGSSASATWGRITHGYFFVPAPPPSISVPPQANKGPTSSSKAVANAEALLLYVPPNCTVPLLAGFPVPIDPPAVVSISGGRTDWRPLQYSTVCRNACYFPALWVGRSLDSLV